MRNLTLVLVCGSASAWPSAFFRGVQPLQVIASSLCVVFASHDLVRKPLHTFRDHALLHHLHGFPEPDMAARGRLDRSDALPARSMALTSSTLPARYGSDGSTDPRLPATVSRNTPATEAGVLWEEVLGAGMMEREIFPSPAKSST